MSAPTILAFKVWYATSHITSYDSRGDRNMVAVHASSFEELDHMVWTFASKGGARPQGHVIHLVYGPDGQILRTPRQGEWDTSAVNAIFTGGH